MRTRFVSCLIGLGGILQIACGGSSEPVAGAGGESTATVAAALERATSAGLHSVPNAQSKVAGIAQPNFLSPELRESPVAQGSDPVENPVTVPAADGSLLGITHYGYDDNGPELPLPGDVPSATHNVEANKTEPDKNTYLVLHGQHGADPSYDYGTHFLFQGHESGARTAAGFGAGYITRINLDADGPHRVTLLAATDENGTPLAPIDGSTWDPFAERLIFTTENGSAPTYQATVDFPSTVQDISGAVGRGGYEGVQNDKDGNLWIIEDVGGPAGTANPHARQPNSFLYRFVPKNKKDLTSGKLQALQVISLRTGQPIAFHAGQADLDITSDDIADLHTYGRVFRTRWVTIHDTDIDKTAPFGANALAKSHQATPFKRPENGVFRPDGQFKQFFFDATGDTNALTEAGSKFGGFGAIFELDQKGPSEQEGTLRLFFNCDVAHSGLDNTSFWDRDHVVFVEDAGDGLHSQRNGLDSAYLFDVRADYSDPANQPVRIVAEGRDPSATFDSALGAFPGFNNEGDNEITGFHVSNGNPGPEGVLGAAPPRPFQRGWRVFFTQQHGDNVSWEILPAAANDASE